MLTYIHHSKSNSPYSPFHENFRKLNEFLERRFIFQKGELFSLLKVNQPSRITNRREA
jgi:hypothetical protein